MENYTPMEGNISTQERPLRSRNFVQDEELQLCCSYLNISQDATIGIGKKSVTFWNRIIAHYDENRPDNGASQPPRSLDSK